MAPHEMAYSYPVFLWKFIPTSLKSDTQIPESYFKGSFFLWQSWNQSQNQSPSQKQLAQKKS